MCTHSNARNGTVFTRNGKLVVRNAAYVKTLLLWIQVVIVMLVKTLLEHIRHLINTNEILGIRLTTIHNIHFLHNLMKDIREAIEKIVY